MSTEQLTSTEVADELGISEATVRRYIHTGILRANKKGPIWLIDPCSVEILVSNPPEEDDQEEEEEEEEDLEGDCVYHCCDCSDDDEDDDDIEE